VLPLLLFSAGGAAAQSGGAPPAASARLPAPPPVPPLARAAHEHAASYGPGSSTLPSALTATLASAALPGAGQLLLGRRRGVLFLAVELVAWGLHLEARSDGRTLRSAYRDLAWAVARGAPEPRVDGNFDYYERLAFWTRSGRFDVDPTTPEVQPERDPETFNGRQWRLAADVFLGGDLDAPPGTEAYTAAIEFYRARAYEERYSWDWRDAPEEQERFVALIQDSDDRFQTASVALAAVFGNHVLSALDAFVAARVDASSPVSLRLLPHPLDPRGSLLLTARIPLPRGRP
jgi:hypothetical protein